MKVAGSVKVIKESGLRELKGDGICGIRSDQIFRTYLFGKTMEILQLQSDGVNWYRDWSEEGDYLGAGMCRQKGGNEIIIFSGPVGYDSAGRFGRIKSRRSPCYKIERQ